MLDGDIRCFKKFEVVSYYVLNATLARFILLAPTPLQASMGHWLECSEFSAQFCPNFVSRGVEER